MSGQSYWGQGPQWGVIHKQDFTKSGASSEWLDLIDYDVRDSTELLVVIDNKVIEPRSGFRLHKHPSYKLELITSLSGNGWVTWLQTKTSKPVWSSKGHIIDQELLSAQPANDDYLVVGDDDGDEVGLKTTYSEFVNGINPPVSGDVGGTVLATLIQPDVVTYDKMQDVVTANRVLGATVAGTVSEIQVPLEAFADDVVDSTKLKDVNDLIVYDAAGSVLFTMYGAGS